VRKTDNLPQSCVVATKSGNLNLLAPSGPVQACHGTAFYNIINLVKEKMDWREIAIFFLSARRDGYLTCSVMTNLLTNLSYADKPQISLVLKQKGARQRGVWHPLTEFF